MQWWSLHHMPQPWFAGEMQTALERYRPAVQRTGLATSGDAGTLQNSQGFQQMPSNACSRRWTHPFWNPFPALRQDNMQNPNLIGSKRLQHNAAQHCLRHALNPGTLPRLDTSGFQMFYHYSARRRGSKIIFPSFLKKKQEQQHLMQICQNAQ